jgi:hypothetical protein
MNDMAKVARIATVARAFTPGTPYFYRFSDPIFQPYVILKGLSSNLISDEQRRMFQVAEVDTEVTPSDFETNTPQQLS